MDQSQLLLVAHGIVALLLAALGTLQVAAGDVAGGGVRIALAAVVLGVGYYVASRNR